MAPSIQAVKGVMKRKATQGGNIHPPRLRCKDTRILFHSCPDEYDYFHLFFFLFFFVFTDGNQS